MDLMASFNEIIRTRRSIRKFSGGPIENDVLKALVEAATFAPSGCDCQNWQFIAIKSKQNIEPLAEAVEKGIRRIFRDEDEDFINSRIKQMTFFRKAPVVFLVYKTEMEYHDPRVVEDLEKYGIPKEEVMNYMGQPDILGVAAAIENLLLKAVELELGACWMCDPIICEPEIAKEFEIPEDWKLVGVIPVGRNGGYFPREKYIKDVDEVLEIIE